MKRERQFVAGRHRRAHRRQVAHSAEASRRAFVLANTVEFEWRAIDRDVEQDFLLEDEAGNTLFSRILSENRRTLRDNVELDVGAGYR